MRYCGEYHDAETGFIYLRARYYDPTIGRFASEDPHWNLDNIIYGDPEESETLDVAPKVPSYIAIAQSTNLYPYCANNPVGFVDPDGESLIALAALAAITVGILLLGGCAAPDDSLYNRGLGFAENFANNSIPGFPGWDATVSPGPGWEWRGNGMPGSSYGAWYNPTTGESLHPDLNHPGNVAPHWDYISPDGKEYRIFEDGSFEEK